MMNVDFSPSRSRQKKKKKKAGRPVAVICYICGRQYGRSSLGIHLKQCKKLWEQREALKPRGERKPVPQAPLGFERRIATGDIEHMSAGAIQAQNTAAFESYNNDALDPCPHCGRTMLPKALEIHLRSCRPGRLIGEKLMSHSGKAGGNLGAGGNNPHEAASATRRRPGSAPRRGTPNSLQKRVPIRERIAQHARMSNGGGGNGGFNLDDVVVAESGGGGDIHRRRSANSAPATSDQPQMYSKASSSRFASSAAQHLGMETSTSSSSSSMVSADPYTTGGEWHEAYDPKSGRNFYYNAQGETRWTLPSARPDRGDTPPSPDVLSHDMAEQSLSASMSARQNGSRPARRTPVGGHGRGGGSGGGGGGGSSADAQRISQLEHKVVALEDQLSDAVEEIARLSRVMKKFQAVFASGGE
jgi:hypothetical protein